MVEIGEFFLCPRMSPKELFMKGNLFQFKMKECGDIGEHITQFNQKISDLLHVDVQLKNDEKAIMFIFFLLELFNHLTTLMIVKETLDFEEDVLDLSSLLHNGIKGLNLAC